MPRKRVEIFQPTDWVELEFKRLCPEPKDKQQAFYLAAAKRVIDWLGPLADRPGCALSLNQVEVNLLVACHATQMLEASNYRAWTASRNLIYFQRAIFKRSLVLGLGQLFRDCYYIHSSENTRWLSRVNYFVRSATIKMAGRLVFFPA